MRRVGKVSFAELVRQNRERLTQDREAMERLEARFEQKHSIPK